MKLINKTNSLLIIAMAFIGLFASCKKDSRSNDMPIINYVRITSPESSDSLLIGAHQGQLIAIIGDNLERTVAIYFNDRKATLTSTYITRKSVLVSVPNPIPTLISNKLKMYFSNGDSLLYDFKVQISEPAVTSMVSEYVNEGDVATLSGNYFYEPLTVTFTGGATASLVSVKDNQLQFKVPAGAQPGPITVKTNFGTTKSNFWFRDNRNIFISSDPWEGWNGSNFVVTNPGAGDPPKINGNYIRVKTKLSSWSWNEIADGDAGSMPNHSKNIPAAAILSPKDYYLKFEVNTMKPYNNGMIRINAGNNVQDVANYQWKPPYDSKGVWNTITIPYEEIVASYAVKPVVDAKGYWSMLLMQGPGDLDADISFDNFRIVPKVIK